LARAVQDANIGLGAAAGPSLLYTIGAAKEERFWEE
jgi:hypothetical protein